MSGNRNKKDRGTTMKKDEGQYQVSQYVCDLHFR